MRPPISSGCVSERTVSPLTVIAIVRAGEAVGFGAAPHNAKSSEQQAATCLRPGPQKLAKDLGDRITKPDPGIRAGGCGALAGLRL